MYYPPKYGEDEAKKIGGNFDDILEWTLRQDDRHDIQDGITALAYRAHKESLDVKAVLPAFRTIQDKKHQGWRPDDLSSVGGSLTSDEWDFMFYHALYRSWAVYLSRQGAAVSSYYELAPSEYESETERVNFENQISLLQ